LERSEKKALCQPF